MKHLNIPTDFLLVMKELKAEESSNILDNIFRFLKNEELIFINSSVQMLWDTFLDKGFQKQKDIYNKRLERAELARSKKGNIAAAL